jgi:FKBP-type peptidyl-prolyl cis-trans isomerase 2
MIKGYTETGSVFFCSEEKSVFITLGDARLPRGLWRSIEHMACKEKAKVKILPGENSFTDDQPELEYYSASEDVMKEMKEQTIYFEVKVLSWIKRSDLDGDGMLMKTYE